MMNNFLIYILSILSIMNTSLGQVKPNIYPFSIKNNYHALEINNNASYILDQSISIDIKSSDGIYQYAINLNREDYYFLIIEIDYLNENDYLFIINKDT